MSATADRRDRSRSTPRGLLLAAGEQKILRALARYHYLCARQIVRLLYSPGSLGYIQSKLKSLSAAGFLERSFLPRPSRSGSAPLVYSLTRRAVSLLSRLGVETRPQTSTTKAHGYLFLAHTLAVNDVLISAERLCWASRRFELVAMRHERDLRRQPTAVTLDDGSSVGVIPDGWLDVRIHLPSGDYQCCLALELDRGTLGQRAWRAKVRTLLAWSRGPYANAFGSRALTIAVVCTTGRLRSQQLLRWTESELRALTREADSDLWRFGSESPLELAPEAFFLGPSWQRPFGRGGQPLIEAPRHGAPRPEHAP